MIGLEKNKVIELEIAAFGSNGEGIGKIDGFPVFVKDAAAGDLCEVRITRVRKNMAYGHLERLIRESEHRIQPACPVSVRCGGCSLQAVDYKTELDYKERRVRDCLQRIGGISGDVLDVAAEPIIGAESPFRYRNKSQYPIGRNRHGEITAGFYAERSHEIIPCGDCMISPPEFTEILKVFTGFMKAHGIEPYDEASGKGLVRHLMLRKAFSTGKIMAVPVLTSEKLPRKEDLIRVFADAGVSTTVANINPDVTNVILGEKNIVLSGTGYLEDKLCGLSFRISPHSFYQVNSAQAEKIYETVLDYAQLKKDDEALDVCCGIGTISLCMAGHCRMVHGVEVMEEAVEDARANAALNGIANVDFTAAAAEAFLPRLSDKNSVLPGLAVMDPPRSGMDKKAIDAVIRIAPERIIYVSCDPATLARDLKIFLTAGYSLRRYRPIDQFCRTSHVETVVLLTRAN